MNLKTFHIVFVTASSLMSFVFGGWCWRYAEANASPGMRLLSVASFGAGVALIVYGFWFWKKINANQNRASGSGKGAALALVLLIWFFGQPVAEACNTCYGEAEGPLIDAARAGVWVLFGLVGAVQAAFVGFFVYLWRRSNGASH
jgi:hypothetical protein